MEFKRYFRICHRWLGLISGLVVFIVSLTGALLAFEKEISDLLYPFRKVEVISRPVVSIKDIKQAVSPYLSHINAIYFNGTDRSIAVRERGLNEKGEVYNNYVFLNPYNGEILKTKFDNNPSFFEIVVGLHLNLLLGEKGSLLVRYATLGYLLILVSGIYLWWPKNRKGIKQRLILDWKRKTRWKRKNFDLHSIFGFYASAILIFAIITGLAWGFQWVDDLIYNIANLGEEKVTIESASLNSDALFVYGSILEVDIEDVILNKAEQIFGHTYYSKRFYFPLNQGEPYRIYISPQANLYYKDVAYYFDQLSGELLKVESPDLKKPGELVRDLYYDIHVGGILGLPGRLLMFFACLISASLPVTGFLIWYGRRKK